jgi:hypothetical protein
LPKNNDYTEINTLVKELITEYGGEAQDGVLDGVYIRIQPKGLGDKVRLTYSDGEMGIGTTGTTCDRAKGHAYHREMTYALTLVDLFYKRKHELKKLLKEADEGER